MVSFGQSMIYTFHFQQQEVLKERLQKDATALQNAYKGVPVRTEVNSVMGDVIPKIKSVRIIKNILFIREAFQKKNSRIKDFVPSRVYPPTLPTTWDTFFWNIFMIIVPTHP